MFLLALAASCLPVPAQAAEPVDVFVADDDDEDVGAPASVAPAPRVEYKMRANVEFADMDVGIGGAQDIGYFRDRVAAGEVPHPNVFTPEGLLSEHDLPLDGPGGCRVLMCPVLEATAASLPSQPEVRWLAQLGFDTGIDAATWRRAPVNLVAVVDKSGSMSGQPIEAVKASLHAAVAALEPGDQLSIVLYGADVHVHLPPTSAARRYDLDRAIDGIGIDGSTNMEAGLAEGFALARRTAPAFEGITRVMLFTDERPNTGRTDAASFMEMARAGSRDGIGMTTVGVGTQFGAELATQVASVRGGNLYFFPDSLKMRETFAADFDTMISELAYDMELRVSPAPGMKLAGVYGIPGDAVRWDGPSLVMKVETLFLSREEGAIFFGFAPDGALPPRSVASMGTVSMSWEHRDGHRAQAMGDIGLTARPQLGLRRGIALVDEATTLKLATALHHEKNDQEGAFQAVRGLGDRLDAIADPGLDAERLLVARLEAKLAFLSGHQGEAPALVSDRHPLNGLPMQR